MAAAIPHAILLLHALLDILPYPRGDKGMWYEIRTGSTECIDEVRPTTSKKKGKEKAVDTEGDVQMDSSADYAVSGQGGAEPEPELDLAGIGAVVEDEPERRARLKVRFTHHPDCVFRPSERPLTDQSSIEIDLHIGPKRSKPLPPAGRAVNAIGQTGKQSPQTGPQTIGKRNRPSKRKREVMKRTHLAEGDKAGRAEVDEDDEDEEAAMNKMNGVAPTQPGKVGKKGQAGTTGKTRSGQVSGMKDSARRAVESEDEEEEELENR